MFWFLFYSIYLVIGREFELEDAVGVSSADVCDVAAVVVPHFDELEKNVSFWSS